MTCLSYLVTEGCFKGQTIFIHHSTDGKGAPAIRYADHAGNIVAGATAANVKAGACNIKTRKGCATVTVAGVDEEWNVLEVTDENGVVSYYDPDTSPIALITNPVVWKADGECMCPCGSSTPTPTTIVLKSSGLNYASPSLQTAYDPSGNGDTWTAPAKLQSFTVAVTLAESIASGNRVMVATPVGKFWMVEGQTKTWSVSQDVSGNEELESGFTVTAEGKSAFDVHWTEYT